VVLLDGTQIHTRRRTGKENRKNYSGKHKHHGLLVIALTDDKGRLLWVSAARPGRTSEITACRHDQLTAKLRAVGLGGIADLGFVGLDDSGPDTDPAVIIGWKARPEPTPNARSEAVQQGAGGREGAGRARLRPPEELARPQPGPHRPEMGDRPGQGLAGPSRTARPPDYRRSSPKSSAHDQHEHPEPYAHQSRDLQLHDAHRSVVTERRNSMITGTCARLVAGAPRAA
jgi:hypothetical protein